MVGKERPVSSGVKLIDEAEVKKPEEEVIDLEILFDLFCEKDHLKSSLCKMPEMVPSQRTSPQASQGEGLHLQQQEHHQSSQGEDQGSLIQHHRRSSQGHDQGLHLQHLAHRHSSQGHGNSSQNWEGEVKNAENVEHPVDLQKTKEIKEEINVKVLNKKFMK